MSRVLSEAESPFLFFFHFSVVPRRKDDNIIRRFCNNVSRLTPRSTREHENLEEIESAAMDTIYELRCTGANSISKLYMAFTKLIIGRLIYWMLIHTLQVIYIYHKCQYNNLEKINIFILYLLKYFE